MIENEGRERQIPHSPWSIFRAKMGMGLGAKIDGLSETILESTKIDFTYVTVPHRVEFNQRRKISEKQSRLSRAYRAIGKI